MTSSRLNPLARSTQPTEVGIIGRPSSLKPCEGRPINPKAQKSGEDAMRLYLDALAEAKRIATLTPMNERFGADDIEMIAAWGEKCLRANLDLVFTVSRVPDNGSIDRLCAMYADKAVSRSTDIVNDRLHAIEVAKHEDKWFTCEVFVGIPGNPDEGFDDDD